MAGKIQDDGEVRRWFAEGRTYAWMVDKYREKYNIETTIAMWSNYRARNGLDRRLVRDPKLIPWKVQQEHTFAHPLMMLRYEARRRRGESVPSVVEKKLDGWVSARREADEVVHYDPDTELGFFYVPRRPGVDKDLIREPERDTELGRVYED